MMAISRHLARVHGPGGSTGRDCWTGFIAGAR